MNTRILANLFLNGEERQDGTIMVPILIAVHSKIPNLYLNGGKREEGTIMVPIHIVLKSMLASAYPKSGERQNGTTTVPIPIESGKLIITKSDRNNSIKMTRMLFNLAIISYLDQQPGVKNRQHRHTNLGLVCTINWPVRTQMQNVYCFRKSRVTIKMCTMHVLVEICKILGAHLTLYGKERLRGVIKTPASNVLMNWSFQLYTTIRTMSWKEMGADRNSKAIASLANATREEQKEWEREFAGLMKKEKMEEGRRNIRLEKEDGMEVRERNMNEALEGVLWYDIGLHVERVVKAAEPIVMGVGDQALKGRLQSSLSKAGVRPVCFTATAKAAGGKQQQYTCISMCGQEMRCNKPSKKKQGIQDAKNIVMVRLMGELRAVKGGRNGLRVKVREMIEKHKAVERWQNIADELGKGEEVQIEKMTVGENRIPLPAIFQGLQPVVAGHRIEVGDWYLQPSHQDKGSKDDIKRKESRTDYMKEKEVTKFENVKDIWKATLNGRMCTEIWHVMKGCWKKTYKAAVTARIQECLEFAEIGGCDAEDKGARIQLSLLSDRGPVTFIFGLYWIPVEVQKILEKREVVMAADCQDDVSLLVLKPWEATVIDPALAYYEIVDKWADQGRYGVEYLGRFLGLDITWLKRIAKKDKTLNGEEKTVRWKDWWKEKISPMKACYCALDSEVMLMAMLAAAWVWSKAKDLDDWEDGVGVKTIIEEMRIDGKNMIIDEEKKLETCRDMSIVTKGGGRARARVRTYRFDDKTDQRRQLEVYLEKVKAEDKKNRRSQGTKRSASYKMTGIEAFLDEEELTARKQSKGGPEWFGDTGLG